LEVGQNATAEPVSASRAFLVAQVHAVSEHRARADQLVVVVDVQIALPRREQFLDPGHLGFVLRDMGVHVQVGIFAEQLAGQI
jgi:hypothetical protein